MSLLALFLTVAFIGLVAWALVTYVPMPSEVKRLIVILAVAVALGIVLTACGVFHFITDVAVPRVD